tara:strand:- start:4563 stop:5369 length:807 start_codon:yes stop_codon:yes gene_type:complete
MYHNKTILITGASSGLGRNLAKHYAKNGGRIINISRDVLKMTSLQNRLKEINSYDHMYFSADVSKYNEIDKIRKVLDKKQIYPDVIVNNAAGNFLCPFIKLSENGWRRIIDIVLNGSFNIYHIFGKHLIENKKGGVFLNISATYSETGSAYVIPSSVAKAGVDNLMRGLTVEWSPHNIRLVGVAPGPISDTGGAQKLDPFNIFKLYNKYTNPRKRMASQAEICDLVLYLTSNKSDYINGEIVRIDGGELVKNAGEFNFLSNVPFKYFI